MSGNGVMEVPQRSQRLFIVDFLLSESRLLMYFVNVATLQSCSELWEGVANTAVLLAKRILICISYNS